MRNEFLVRLVNKQPVPARFVITVTAKNAVEQNGLNKPVIVPPLGEEVRALVLRVPRADYAGPFAFGIFLRDTKNTFTLKREARFLGPDADLLNEERGK
ncbi:MAG: hypothetical protein KGJ37_04985 [Verrucomicrobiota bacterium]|nr:hypothetical protein [Verrucomicrobiota bacterium]